MDRKIEHKSPIRKKYVIWVVIALVLLTLVMWLVLGDHRPSLRVDGRTLTVMTVKKGEFNDFVRVNGTVQPLSVVQLTPLEGGIVEERLVEEGAKVKKGDVVLRLSNPQLNIQILESEASLAEKENFLRNTRVEMEQEKLTIRREMLSVNMEIARKKRKYEQNKTLWAEELISEEEYLVAKEDYEYSVENVTLLQEREKQDSIFRELQVVNLEQSLESMKRNMTLVRQRVDNLSVRSIIDGELGLLDVVLGQSIVSGQKLGQINDLTDFKIEVLIDEHYIDRVSRGLVATFERGGESYSLVVSRVFPEVREGQFRTWLTFEAERPENIRTGQTYYVNLELGSPTEAIIIPRGAFYQQTGGQWIYVVEDGVAVKRPIRISRQNPQYYEVTEGLTEGEQVITSSYQSYNNVDILDIQ
ncbi:MAG: HlyD family efflux transporter periplasmic adaptor subunit [Rikenellaceae bacterium]